MMQLLRAWVRGLALTLLLAGGAVAHAATASGAIGTPAYMSPEQCRGLALDGRSDLYSLGCVAYNMGSGRAPFRSDSTVGYLLAHVQEPVPSLPASVPEPLAAWTLTCLAKSSDDRFASAENARDLLLDTLSASAARGSAGRRLHASVAGCCRRSWHWPWPARQRS